MRLELDGVVADPDAVAAYAKVCGFALRDHLPPTYPHVLAFPLHMALMSDGRFPFGAVGLVHVANKITQHRRLGIGEELDLRVAGDEARSRTRKARRSTSSPRSRVGRQIAWECDQHLPAPRQGRPGRGGRRGVPDRRRGRPGERRVDASPATSAAATRAVSGDRNPIHMHSLTAKPLGFPAAIAHGMWTKARALAALEPRLPDAFAADVRFRRPILLPAKVEFATPGRRRRGDRLHACAAAAKRTNRHLDGRVTPVAAKTKTQRKGKVSTDDDRQRPGASPSARWASACAG